MQQLRQVQNQLGFMMNAAGSATVLNPQVTSNLNSYISKQKEQILQMSQSSEQMTKLVQEANAMQRLKAQQEQQAPSVVQFAPPPVMQSAEKELPVTSQTVDIPRAPPVLVQENEPEKIDFTPPPDEDDNLDLQK